MKMKMEVNENISADSTLTRQVSSQDSLNSAITEANAMSASDTLTIQINVNPLTLTGSSTAINTAGVLTIEPSDNEPVTINGAGWWNAIVVLSCQQLNLNSLIIQSTSCRGASGCLGAGGGLLIANVSEAIGYSPKWTDTPPNVILSNVSFLHCSAIGGRCVEHWSRWWWR